MLRHLAKALLVVVLFGLTVRPGAAQEFRVYTRVYNEGAAERNPQLDQAPVVTRSLSLFHAGKVYDYVDSAREVTIFEPTEHRFTILNTARAIRTTVDFDQLRHMLKVARYETEKYLAELEQSRKPGNRQRIAALRFQLNPTFEEDYDAKSGRLTLDSPHIRYDVRCAKAATPEVVEAYLRYADWVKRLNYVLHPHALFPAPRLALNANLRRKTMIPTEVTLEATVGTRLHMRAEHQIHWNLDSKDRSLLHRWETLRDDENTKPISFRRYQQTVLDAEPGDR